MNRDLTAKKETRTVLLFVPEELLQGFAVLSLLQIKKTDGKVDYTVSGLNRREVQQHFPAIPESAQALLLQFQPDTLATLQKDVEVRYKKQKAGIPLSVFRPQAMLRHLHQQFKELLPFYPL